MINNYSFRCPKCGSTNTVYDASMVLTSNPPKNKCKCRDCGEVFYSSNQATSKVDWTNKDSLDDMWKQDQSILNVPKVGDPIPGDSWIPMTPSLTKPVELNYGWVCPRCGRVMAPNQSYCIFCCDTGTTVQVNESTGNDILNLKKLLEDSPTINDPFIYDTKLGAKMDNNYITTTNCDMNKLNQSNIISSKSTGINEEMKQKFLRESDSVMEAVDKYIEWEKELNK